LIAELIEMSSDLKVSVMVFSEKSQYFAPMQMEYLIIILKKIRHNPVFSPKSEMVERVRELFQSMFETIRDKDFQFREQAVRGYAMVLTAYGQQWIIEQEKGTGSIVRKETLFDRFMDLVVESRGRERKVEYYASRLCLTPKYVSEAIYMSTKRHATEWIRDYVVLEAQVLLRTPGMSVQAVSEALEFANPSFFCKYFKAATGMTPLEYSRG
jgi:AraC-like DNA-binding protein